MPAGEMEKLARYFNCIAFVNHTKFKNSSTSIISQFHHSSSMSNATPLSWASPPSLLRYHSSYPTLKISQFRCFLPRAAINAPINSKMSLILTSSLTTASKYLDYPPKQGNSSYNLSLDGEGKRDK